MSLTHTNLKTYFECVETGSHPVAWAGLELTAICLAHLEVVGVQCVDCRLTGWRASMSKADTTKKLCSCYKEQD